MIADLIAESFKYQTPHKCAREGTHLTNIELFFSIKHDLARSFFQLWPKIGDEGDKISREKTGEALAETVFFSKSCDPWSRFWKKIKVLEIFPEISKVLKIMKNFEKT